MVDKILYFSSPHKCFSQHISVLLDTVFKSASKMDNKKSIDLHYKQKTKEHKNRLEKEYTNNLVNVN